MKLRVLRADPAGNTTLFVLDPVPPAERSRVAAKLMAMPGLAAEQVGFLCPTCQGGQGRMEMAGGEFCGNATRAFGMLAAQEQGGASQVLVEVSGCGGPVRVDVDWTTGSARAQMPLPRAVRPVEAADWSGTLVDLGGIAHLVVEGRTPSLEFFQRVEPLFQDIRGLEAYGVVFLDPANSALTPLVKVPSAGTLVWEGSCGSGSLAAAIAQSRELLDCVFLRDYVQPAGVIQVSVVRQNGAAVSACIGGPVTLDSPVAVEI